MGDFKPYTDEEIVTFGLIPNGLADFEITAASRGQGKKHPYIKMKVQCTGGSVSTEIDYFHNIGMQLTFKHFYQAAGLVDFFLGGIMLSPDQCIGVKGQCIVSTKKGDPIPDKPGQFFFDKNVIDDFLYPGYDPLRHDKPAPEIDGQADQTEDDNQDIPF